MSSHESSYKRVCKTCKDGKPVSMFTGCGTICLPCKTAAKARRAERKNVSLTPHEWEMVKKFRAAQQENRNE